LKYQINKNFNTGFALQNIGNKLKYISESYPLPKIVRLGGNYNFLIEKDFESQKTLSTFLDINYLQDTDFNLGGGIEMKIDYIKSSAFAIRTGYKTDNGDKRAGFSIGFGLDMKNTILTILILLWVRLAKSTKYLF